MENALVQLGVGGIFAIMIIDRVFRYVNGRNNKPTENPLTLPEMRNEFTQVQSQMRERDEILFRKFDEQTKLLNSIDKTLAVVSQRLDARRTGF